jgi:hypothetical protein
MLLRTPQIVNLSVTIQCLYYASCRIVKELINILKGVCRFVDGYHNTRYRYNRKQKTGTTSYNPLGIYILNVWWLLFVQGIYRYMCTVYRCNGLGVFAWIGWYRLPTPHSHFIL